MEVKVIKDLPDALEFIVPNDDALKQKHGFQSTSSSLIREFMIFFNIRLYFIVFEGGKFQITSENIMLSHNEQKKQAFIISNGDKTVSGVLYTYNLKHEIQTVFDMDDMRIQHYVFKYIEDLNSTSTDKSGDAISTLPNSSDQISLTTTENNTRVCAPSDHIAQGIVHQNTTLKVFNILTPLLQEPEINSNNCDRIRANVVTTCEQGSSVLKKNIDVQRSITMSLTTEITSAPSSTVIKYRKPVLLKPIRPHWKIRHQRDLIKKLRNTTTGRKQKKIQYIELLHSIGNGNVPLNVKIPSREKRQMYLAITVRTIDNQPHSLKVIVPEKTKADINRFSHNNDLNYLEFDECNPMHKFDLDTKIVYMKITPREHQQTLKKIPIHMVNLYQNQHLTKDMIKREELNKCRLAFWLCVKSHGEYIPVSAVSLTDIITERK